MASNRIPLAVATMSLAVGVAGLGVHFARELDVPLHAAVASLTGAVRPPLRYSWRLVDGAHWQIVAYTTESSDQTDALEGTRGACMAGMVEVKGEMKLDNTSNPYDSQTIEELQKTTCTQWINRDYPERCALFDRAKWLRISAELKTRPMRFCIDRFEYPNEKGQYPVISVSFHEAAALCKQEGKRLCNEAEWTFACEGEEATPYPYGYVRDATACVVDLPWRPYNETHLRPRDGFDAMSELDKLWQGVPSGSRPRCRSVFGVYDMTGNVDEWTRSVREGERPSILKGGYWGPVRTRCRPSTRSHDENHIFYQQGVRCCADPGALSTKVSGPSADPATAPLPRELR